MPPSPRLSHLLFRCHQCGRLITKYQIIAIWEYLEANPAEKSKGLCSCGSGKISPANATVWEELTTPAIWYLWWRDIVAPRLGL
jgi:hypothetical protein